MKNFAWVGVLAVLAIGCRHAEKRDPNEGKGEEAGVPQTEEAAPRQKKTETPTPLTAPKTQSGIPLATGPGEALVDGGVAQLQRALVERGFQVGADGKFDSATTEALRQFQEREELPRTGAPDRATLKKLRLDPDKLLRKAAPP